MNFEADRVEDLSELTTARREEIEAGERALGALEDNRDKPNTFQGQT